jgi:hypothetical protein
MTKILTLIGAMIMTAHVFAQSDSTKTPETEIEDPSRDRIIMNVHWDGWLGAPDSLNVKGLSSGMGFHFYYDIPLGSGDAKDNVSFAIGAGFNWSNYYNNSQFLYDTALDLTYTVPFGEDLQVSKNKMVVNYVEVPIEFRFRTDEKNGNRFKAAIGFKGGYVISTHTKYVGDDYITGTENEIKFKQYRLNNITNLQFGPTLRLGYSKVNIEAYYGLAPLFIDGQGPTGSPLTVGISFNPF